MTQTSNTSNTRQVARWLILLKRLPWLQVPGHAVGRRMSCWRASEAQSSMSKYAASWQQRKREPIWLEDFCDIFGHDSSLLRQVSRNYSVDYPFGPKCPFGGVGPLVGVVAPKSAVILDGCIRTCYARSLMETEHNQSNGWIVADVISFVGVGHPIQLQELPCIY